MVMSSAAFAQSAENFNTNHLAPVPPPAKPEPAKAKESAPTGGTPSRFIGPAELDGFVSSMTTALSMHDRASDPFGQPEDPNAKPVIKTSVAKSAQRVAQPQAVPLTEIVRLIVVTTIMPGEKRFLIGTRSFAKGDHIPLVFRNKQLRLQVTDVSSQEITFKNLDSGETASRKLDMLPVGMTPGLQGITAHGMTADGLNLPIELEGGEPATENSQKR
jgi:hypothetical protein